MGELPAVVRYSTVWSLRIRDPSRVQAQRERVAGAGPVNRWTAASIMTCPPLPQHHTQPATGPRSWQASQAFRHDGATTTAQQQPDVDAHVMTRRYMIGYMIVVCHIAHADEAAS